MQAGVAELGIPVGDYKGQHKHDETESTQEVRATNHGGRPMLEVAVAMLPDVQQECCDSLWSKGKSSAGAIGYLAGHRTGSWCHGAHAGVSVLQL